KMYLDEVLVAYRKQAVAGDVGHDVVVDGVLIQTLALYKQLRVKFVFQHIIKPLSQFPAPPYCASRPSSSWSRQSSPLRMRMYCPLPDSVMFPLDMLPPRPSKTKCRYCVTSHMSSSSSVMRIAEPSARLMTKGKSSCGRPFELSSR